MRALRCLAVGVCALLVGACANAKPKPSPSPTAAPQPDVASTDDAGDSEWDPDGAIDRALALEDAGQIEAAIAEVERLREHVGDDSDAEYVALILGTLGRLEYARGSYDKALDYNGRAIALARETGDMNYLPTYLYAEGWIQLKRGQPELARKAWKEALLFSEVNGDHEFSATLRQSLAEHFD